MEGTSIDLKKTYLGFSFYSWNRGLISLEVIILCLMLGSLLTPKWVQQGYSSTIWKGGLLVCGGCDGLWENQYYTSITEIAQDNDVQGYYSTFKNLAISGLVYLILEIISLAVIASIVVLGITYKFTARPHIKKLFGALTALHTTATVSWFGINSASFTADCKVSSDYTNSEKICPTVGPIIAICIEICIPIIILIETWAYYNWKKLKSRVLQEIEIPELTPK